MVPDERLAFEVAFDRFGHVVTMFTTGFVRIMGQDFAVTRWILVRYKLFQHHRSLILGIIPIIAFAFMAQPVVKVSIRLRGRQFSRLTVFSHLTTATLSLNLSLYRMFHRRVILRPPGLLKQNPSSQSILDLWLLSFTLMRSNDHLCDHFCFGLNLCLLQ
jgi:hypothetical protein